MDEGEILRKNLSRLMHEQGLNPARLSALSGMNRRAVNDILEGRAQSPKLSTVFKLARGLNCHPGELIGFGPRVNLVPVLAELLQQYDEADQERLAAALAQLPPAPASRR